MMPWRRRTPAGPPAVRQRPRLQTAPLPLALAAPAVPAPFGPAALAAAWAALRRRQPVRLLATAAPAEQAWRLRQVRRFRAWSRAPRAWRRKNPGWPRTPFEGGPLRPESAADQSAGARSPPADSPQALARRRTLRDT